jgi:hypothetical protein
MRKLARSKCFTTAPLAEILTYIKYKNPDTEASGFALAEGLGVKP